MTMYELMTLQQVPPKDVSVFEFDSDIKDGIRPSFLEEVVCNYNISDTVANYIVWWNYAHHF